MRNADLYPLRSCTPINDRLASQRTGNWRFEKHVAKPETKNRGIAESAGPFEGGGQMLFCRYPKISQLSAPAELLGVYLQPLEDRVRLPLR